MKTEFIPDKAPSTVLGQLDALIDKLTNKTGGDLDAPIDLDDVESELDALVKMLSTTTTTTTTSSTTTSSSITTRSMGVRSSRTSTTTTVTSSTTTTSRSTTSVPPEASGLDILPE